MPATNHKRRHGTSGSHAISLPSGKGAGISDVMAPPSATVPASDPFALTLAAWELAQAGDPAGALTLVEQALTLAPRDPVALTTRGGIFREMGRLRDAVLSCDAAIAAAPEHAPAWLERGFVMTAGGSIDAAYDCYARAAALDPATAAAWAGMASIAARRGDGAAARDHAAHALAIDPGNAIATCALATVEIEAGEAATAEARLAGPVQTLALASPEQVLASSLRGDALDRLDRTSEAFSAYAASKQAFATIHAPAFAARTQTHREFIEGISQAVSAIDDTDNWALPDPSDPPRHVFLLGYPRSGTTLVENILASLPGCTALEERPTLRDADQVFLDGAGGMATLATLGETGAAQFRSAYWARVAAANAIPPEGGMFVDMDPLKGIRLPIIARLFPHARIVIMRRDPRDVVWSCFRTNFTLTNAADDFTTLERAARHYDALMHLTALSIERFHLQVHAVRYDRIVRDFDAETRALCDFLGVPWTAHLRDFNRTAKARGVATASAAQVRKPLYDGTRQWERYRAQMEPVLPILAPWVERFGFDA
jgi:Tfp pilus assembly protein PilF